jgi:hypothetical protein
MPNAQRDIKEVIDQGPLSVRLGSIEDGFKRERLGHAA